MDKKLSEDYCLCFNCFYSRIAFFTLFVTVFAPIDGTLREKDSFCEKGRGRNVGYDLKDSDRTACTAPLLEGDVLELVGYKPWEA